MPGGDQSIRAKLAQAYTMGEMIAARGGFDAFREGQVLLSRMSDEEQESMMAGCLDYQVRAAQNQAAVQNHPVGSPGHARQLIQHFRKQRTSFKDIYEKIRDGTCPSSVAWSVSEDTKPDMPTTDDRMLPLAVQNLKINTTHKGRVFFGKTIEDPYFSGSATFLLQDPFGGVVEVAVYNIPNCDWHVTEKAFPVGRFIAIKEPYYKIRSDGTPGIRIDNPRSDIVDATFVFPKTAMQWKEYGNGFFHPSVQEYKLANECYGRALNLLNKECSQLAILFTNRALCNVNQDDDSITKWQVVLRLASVAVRLDDNNFKAAFRQAEALHHLDPVSGKTLIAFYARKWPNNDNFKNLVRAHQINVKVESDSTKLHSEWCFCSGVVAYLDQPTGAPSDKTWKELKEAGATAFGDHDFVQADVKYAQAAQVLLADEKLKVLLPCLLNQSVAYLHLARSGEDDSLFFHKSLWDSSVAGLLDPSREKAWLRLATALEQIKGPSFTLQVLAGVPFEEVKKEIKKIEKRAKAKQRSNPVSSRSTAEQQDAYNRGTQLPDRNLVPPREGKMMKDRLMMMLSMFPGKKKEILKKNPLMDRKIPPFHEQYPKERGWPQGVPDGMREKLFEAHTMAQDCPWFHEMICRMGMEIPQNAHDFFKRFHGSVAVEWMRTRQPNIRFGDVVNWKEGHEIPFYGDYIRMNFTNNAAQKETMYEGSVHVAVGFNDLSPLLRATLGTPQNSNHTGPLKFIGIDMNPFVVAKSLIVGNMIADPSTPLEHVIQVWYSATWSHGCFSSFQAAVSRVLSELEKQSSTDPRVLGYVQHWLSGRPISVATARENWDVLHDGSRTHIGNLKRHNDRMALVHYFITGDIFGLTDEQPQMGSMTMWCVPEGSPITDKDESAFQGFRCIDLWQEIQANADCDIVGSMCRILHRDLAKVRNWIIEKKVEIEIECSQLRVSSPMLKSIKQRRPYTMSWSNICDYFRPSNFHKMVRACSQEDTVHYGHTMNWVAETFGTHIMDYDGASKKVQIMDDAHKHEKSWGRSTGLDKFLVLPLHENPYNCTQDLLASKYFKNWVQYFFNESRTGCPCEFLGDRNAPPSFDPFSQANGTKRLMWTYKTV